MNSDVRPFLPWWAWIVVAIEIAVPVVFSTLNIINPAAFGGGPELTDYQTLYITRNYTMALGVLVAVLLRNYVGLFVAVFIRFSTDFVDIVSGLIGGDPQMLQVIAILFVPLMVLPSLLLFYLWKRIR